MSEEHDGIIERVKETARITGLDPAQILGIIERAEESFYNSLAGDTGAETGDVSPGPLLDFSKAAQAAALAWLRNNVTPELRFPKIGADWVAALPTFDGWFAAWEYPGYVQWHHESNRVPRIVATPGFHERGMVPFDVTDEYGHVLAEYADEPWDGTVERYMALIRPVLERFKPWQLTLPVHDQPDQVQALIEDAASGDKLAQFHLRSAVLYPRENHAVDPTAPLCTVVVTLAIEGDADDAMEVVNRVLDDGPLQDAINDHDVDGAGHLRVVSVGCM